MCLTQIRQKAISHDNNTVLCCCEDGSVVRWDRNQEEDVTNIEGEEAQGAAGPLRPAPATNRCVRSAHLVHKIKQNN